MSETSDNLYLIGLGSNIRHARFGSPRAVVGKAYQKLSKVGEVSAIARIIDSAPLGPSNRRYANGAAILQSDMPPDELLCALKQVEHEFGIRRGGRWRARVLDLDIVLWSGGIWASRELAVPHRSFRERPFVLGPAESIAPDWRDPVTSLLLGHLNARLTKPRPVPSGRLR